MFACGRVVFLVVVTFLRTVQASTDAAPCVAMETCLLPCRFSPGGDLVVHWYQEKTKHNVHSFYHDRNQLGAQDPSFRGRTALFQDQISRGNASLRLTGVTIQDQGLYKCYTGTNERTMEVFNHLQVNGTTPRVPLKTPPFSSLWTPPFSSLWTPPFSSLWTPPFSSLWTPPFSSLSGKCCSSVKLLEWMEWKCWASVMLLMQFCSEGTGPSRMAVCVLVSLAPAFTHAIIYS
uniref:Ig-like domain-containing protein n=1 Tax=Gasterosteus aculeatus aculeatus TaxID=481459 RepID=G3PHI9_GASAC